MPADFRTAEPDLAMGPSAFDDCRAIAVMPFTNFSGDLEQEFFPDGITEDSEIERLDEAAVDAHRWPSISSSPAPGQGGKDIVVLDRWAEDRTEGAVSSLARSRTVSVL